jgi:hypothetical protein
MDVGPLRPTRRGLARPSRLGGPPHASSEDSELPLGAWLQVIDRQRGAAANMAKPLATGHPSRTPVAIYGVRTREVRILSPSPAKTFMGTGAPVFM